MAESPVTFRRNNRSTSPEYAARNLRLLGVEANATERAVRGETRKAQKDGIYRASQRGDSTYLRAQAEAVAAELLKGNPSVEPRKRKLVETRKAIEGGWRSIADRLSQDGHDDLARDTQKVVGDMPPARTEREAVAEELRRTLRDQPIREQHRVR